VICFGAAWFKTEVFGMEKVSERRGSWEGRE